MYTLVSVILLVVAASTGVVVIYAIYKENRGVW